MRELPAIFQTVEALLGLEPEELGAEMLLALRKRPGNGPNESMFNFSNLVGELRGTAFDKSEVHLALAEAWAWLGAQGLLVPAPTQIGSSGWVVLSRRALRFEDRGELKKFDIVRRLPLELLHPKLQRPVWSAFMRGEYDVGIFQAMKTVEVEVRRASGLSDLIGVKLMRAAFHPETGPLTDTSSDFGERAARSDLFAGAIGSFKNPHSHREVELDDPQEAIEIVMLASHLLRIVEARTLIAALGMLYSFPSGPKKDP